MKMALMVLAGVVLLFAAYVLYLVTLGNSGVARELRDNPDGERAQRAMLLTFADGRTIPVNYLREGDTVYVGADGPWWRVFRGEGSAVTVYIKGQSMAGHGTVVLDDQAFVDEVFARLRPAAPAWLPDWLNGRLVVIALSARQEAES